MRSAPGEPARIVAWQQDLRARLFGLLKLQDLVPQVRSLQLDPKNGKSWSTADFAVEEMTIQSTPGRRIEIVVTVPKQGRGPFPAVVCIGGHESNRFTPYTNGRAFGEHPAIRGDHLYKGFAAALAAKGYVTFSTLVSQHDVYESGRTLMGERLWDLMRCVSYIESLPIVNKSRLGCGGLSLGGEMTMWLAAMDTRIAAADSVAFLTMMDQLEAHHCMCWKFAGLRELVDWPDIYALIAPRPLECQNGRKEPPTDFTPQLAAKAMADIRPIYASFGKAENVSLKVHDGDHEVDLPALLAFFDKNLKH